MHTLEEYDVVPEFRPASAFALRLIDRGDTYYELRTNRNIGWITKEEQSLLRNTCVAIAGTGGMGGLVAQAMVRLGIGEIRIADPESFELSNMNRQAACGDGTIGRSKAIETARSMRAITNDYRLVVYPQGITVDTAAEFIKGADVIIDEIEFWNISSCIHMHQAARACGIAIFNGLSVGFASYLHLFTPQSMHVETLLGLSLSEADRLERAVLEGTISDVERVALATKILNAFIPSIPNYSTDTAAQVMERLIKEGTASIITTNPLVAAGIVANQVLLYLLASFGSERSILQIPVSPGYGYFDAARFEMKVIVKRKER
ncbi:MAG: molybdopterin biosynthesis MoeB protein [Parcubacteria group bacterium]|nr:molybdopterin biosynthesis MoeB protein [Parcubacteria group bacterium]